MLATISNNLGWPSWLNWLLGSQAARRSSQRSAKWVAKCKEWIRRYLLADLTATVTGLLGVYIATQAGATLVAVAYIGSIAEAVGYYTPILIKDLREQRLLSQTGALKRTVRNLVVEFGVAELLDSGAIRPAIMALCITWIPNLGIATYVGMSVADIFFYGFAIVGYELRKRFLPNAEANEAEASSDRPSTRRNQLADGPVATQKVTDSMVVSMITSMTHDYHAEAHQGAIVELFLEPSDSANEAAHVGGAPIVDPALDPAARAKAELPIEQNPAGRQSRTAQRTTQRATPHTTPYTTPGGAPRESAPAALECDATVRQADAVAPPLLGHLVRVTGDQSLPSVLPIYQLAVAEGEERQVRIGRHSKRNTVVINTKHISREHALIIQKDGSIYLQDNNSSAGTYLNWRRLHGDEALLVRHGDLLRFADVVYEYQAS